MKVVRRTFEAAKFPKGSADRERLNLDWLTSEYMPSYRYGVRNDDGTKVMVGLGAETFRTKREAEAAIPGAVAKGKVAKTAKNARYYTYAHNVVGGLENGSFVREYADGERVHYMNGDFMGAVEEVPANMKEVPTDLALSLLPTVCK